MTAANDNDVKFKISYSYKEAAKATGSSRTTLWRLVKAGELEARPVRGRVFLTRESLEAKFGSLKPGSHKSAA